MKTLLTFTISLLALSLSAQFASHVKLPDSTKAVVTDMADPSVKFASTITKEEIKKHIFTIAGDAFEGRETGEPGNEMAAQYIAEHFKSIGLPAINGDNKYYQPVAFTFTKWNDNVIYINGEKYKHLWDFINFPKENDDLDELKTDEVVFVGYGIDHPNYSDYNGTNVKGKVVMMYKGEPKTESGKYHVNKNNQPSAWGTNLQMKLITARNKGAKAVLVVEEDIQKMAMENRRFLLGSSVELGDMSVRKIKSCNYAYISTKVLEAILGEQKDKVIAARDLMNAKGKSKAITLKSDFTLVQDKSAKVLAGQNILGFVEGTDKKEEIVVVSAHYDHLGKRGDDIFNGADDNASGTTTVLELADAFQKAKLAGNGPRRSILFLLVTGEEKGLLGSAYYAENPIFPLNNTVVDVNIDMVGRYDNKYLPDSSKYIFVIGSDRLSTKLHEINEQVNDKYSHLILDYTFNSEDDPNRYYYRSDHYNFAEKGIPAIFFFNGTHEDYHRPSDTPDKIDLQKMQDIGRHVFHLIWDLSNREERIKVDVQPVKVEE